jgi:Xanthine and CO dehydrogenases maturation factor, XdhC/CoxF family
MATFESAASMMELNKLLSDVRCPIGLNVGADSPEEIAIAVLAEILSLHKGVDVHSPTWRESRS